MRKVYFSAIILNDKPTGLGIYTINIMRRLDEYGIIDTVVFNNSDEEKRYSNMIKNAKTTNIGNEKKKLKFFYRNFLMSKFVKKNLSKNDVLYSPTQHGVKINNIVQIITVHDLIPLFYPNGRIHQYIYYKFILPGIFKYCSKVITVSSSTKNDLLSNYNINSNQVEVIYNGYNKPKCLNVKQSKENVCDKYGVQDYILMVGINYEYKNLHSVIEAYSKIKDNIHNKLIIVGNYKNSYGRSLVELVKKLGLQNRVIFLGYVSDDDLESLYQACSIFVYPSIYEGFGLPVLEAAANGALVISSNKSSIPEVCKDFAVLIDTEDINLMCDSIIENLDYNQKDYHEKVNLCLKNFDWDLTVKKIYNILK